MENGVITFWERFGQISDPREASGRRYSLQSVLELISAGILSGNTSLRAIAKWGRELTCAQLAQFNIRRKSPSQTTMHYLLQRMDSEEMERIFKGWIVGTFLERWFDEGALREQIARIRSDTDRWSEYASLRVMHAYLHNIAEAVRRMAEEFTRSEWKLPEWMRQEYLASGIRMPEWFNADWKTPEWLSKDMRIQFENLRRMCLVFRQEGVART